MKYKIHYEPLSEKHINAAADLVLSAYKEEVLAVPFLPYEQDFLGYFQKKIGNLFNKGTGIVALCDRQLIGFLTGFEINELWGRCKGIYSPIYGHGVIKEYRSSLYQEMYRQVADLWVRNSCMTHAITLFAHDKATINTWFWLGFGLRCVDAIREVTPITVNAPAISINKIDINGIPSLADIERMLHLYFRNSPMFMPRIEEDPNHYLTEWLQKQNHHMWAAYHKGEPLGLMQLQPHAETFVSEHHDVMNITGAYVVDSERGSGIGAMLLGEVQQWLLHNGYPLCGVDFESFNITGSNFWTKYFTPYTHSVVRRIDERII